MMKKNIFACALMACTLLLSCAKSDIPYGDLFVGRYKVEIKSYLADGSNDVSNSQPFSYTMKIDKLGEDSLIVALDSVTRGIGYADADGLHVERIALKQKYLVHSQAEESMCNFNCTLNLVQFTMPCPISNGTDQRSDFRVTTTGSGTIDHTHTSDLYLEHVVGTSVVKAIMLNDPNAIVERDTTAFPPF